VVPEKRPYNGCGGGDVLNNLDEERYEMLGICLSSVCLLAGFLKELLHDFHEIRPGVVHFGNIATGNS